MEKRVLNSVWDVDGVRTVFVWGSDKPPFSERNGGSITNDKVIEYTNVDQCQGVYEATGNAPICT